MVKRVRVGALLILALSLWCGSSVHGTESADSSKPEERWLLKAGRLLDVASGDIVRNAAVLVSGDRIERVGSEADLEAELGSELGELPVLDLGDVTLLPGLMDLHTHLTVGSARPRGRSSYFMPAPVDIAYRAADNARATLMAGFTTVREAGALDFIDVALKRAIESGYAVGPRIVPSGYQISITGGHGDELGWPPGLFEVGPENGVADGKGEVLKAIRYQIKHGAEVIKVTATAGVLGPEATADARQFSDEELQAIVDEARRQRVKVLAHAHGLEGIRAAVRAGVDSIEHGSQLDRETARLMREQGVFLVPTAWINTEGGGDRGDRPPEVEAKGRQITRQAREALRIAIEEGVPLAFGTDAGVYPHGQNAAEFGTLVRAGLEPIAALRSATIDAARLLGVEDRGEIRAGLLADLIAVAGNPLDNVSTLEQVRFVMKGGIVYLCGGEAVPLGGGSSPVRRYCGSRSYASNEPLVVAGE